MQGILLTDLARAADFVLAGASYLEKDACYTNDKGMVQAAAQAVTPPGDAMEDWQILVNVAVSLGVGLTYTSSAHIRADIAAGMAERPGYAGHRPHRVRAAGRGAHLAADVEPVRALEVGHAVQGPAAGEVRWEARIRRRCRPGTRSSWKPFADHDRRAGNCEAGSGLANGCRIREPL